MPYHIPKTRHKAPHSRTFRAWAKRQIVHDAGHVSAEKAAAVFAKFAPEIWATVPAPQREAAARGAHSMEAFAGLMVAAAWNHIANAAMIDGEVY